MRGVLTVVTVLWLSAPAAAQDAGTPSPSPSPSLSPEAVAAGTADSIGPIDETAVAIDRAEDWLVDGQRRDAIRHGRVSGWYAEVGRSMRTAFHPDLTAMESERRAGMSLPEIALDELARYGPPEAPRGPAAVYTPEVRTTTPEDAQVDQNFEIQSFLNAHTRWSRVEVHVIQDRQGHVLSTSITHSSDSHALDAAAVEAITTAAIAAPPPAQVLGERQTIDSDWSFWAGEVVPYIGQAGCMEGPDGQGLQCTALGRPILRTRVVLLDVHDAEHERPVRTRTRTTPHTHAAPAEHARREGEPVRDVSPDLPTHALAPPGAP